MSQVAQSVYCLITEWTAGVRSPTGSEDFSSNLCVQTRPHIQWIPEAFAPGVKRGRGVMLTAHLLLLPRLRKSRSYTSSHPNAPVWSVTGPLYLFIRADNFVPVAWHVFPVTVSSRFFKIHFSIILSCMHRPSDLFLQGFQPKFCLSFSFIPCFLYTPPILSLMWSL
jgi:hypothetical protein